MPCRGRRGEDGAAAVTHHVSRGSRCWSGSLGEARCEPGADGSSRVIFTNQWVAVPEQELLLLPEPVSPR